MIRAIMGGGVRIVIHPQNTKWKVIHSLTRKISQKKCPPSRGLRHLLHGVKTLF
jgi:hypothetical protein